MAIRDTFKLRRLSLENSAATALIDANMPPMPSPVNTRHTDRSYTPFARVAMTIPNVITTRQPSNVRRRPILSATPPNKIEPKPMPISSIESTIPNAARSIPHSRAMPGEAKLIASTSKPSIAFRPMVIATAAIWATLMLLTLNVLRGSDIDIVCSRVCSAPVCYAATALRRARVPQTVTSNGHTVDRPTARAG